MFRKIKLGVSNIYWPVAFMGHILTRFTFTECDTILFNLLFNVVSKILIIYIQRN